MNSNTYPDGFPILALDAINFSYFLSEQEKQEWREWLNTATPEQHQELIETLHAMWVENQKQVVPQGFTAAQPAPAPMPAPVASTQPAVPAPRPQAPQQAQQQAARPAQPVQQPQAQQAQRPTQNTPTQNNQNVQNFGQQRFTSSPVLQQQAAQSSQRPQAQTQAAQQQPVARPAQPAPQPQVQRPTPQPAPAPQVTAEPKEQKFFNVQKIRETSTRKALEDVYSSYISSRERSFASEKEYIEDHAAFLDKIMAIVVHFEQVSDYFESMTEKLLEMNDKIVAQAKDIQQIKNNTQALDQELGDQVDIIKSDMDKQAREVRDLKVNSTKRYQELSEAVALQGADTYRGEALNQKLEIINSKIAKLEQSGNATTAQPSIRDRLRKLDTSTNNDAVAPDHQLNTKQAPSNRKSDSSATVINSNQ